MKYISKIEGAISGGYFTLILPATYEDGMYSTVLNVPLSCKEPMTLSFEEVEDEI